MHGKVVVNEMRVNLAPSFAPLRAPYGGGAAAAAFHLPPPAAAVVAATRPVESARPCAIASARRHRALRAGRGVLDALERYKAHLLEGRAATALAALRERLEAAGEDSGDPLLDDLLAHIRLRAEVELAKREARQQSDCRRTGSGV